MAATGQSPDLRAGLAGRRRALGLDGGLDRAGEAFLESPWNGRSRARGRSPRGGAGGYVADRRLGLSGGGPAFIPAGQAAGRRDGDQSHGLVGPRGEHDESLDHPLAGVAGPAGGRVDSAPSHGDFIPGASRPRAGSGLGRAWVRVLAAQLVERARWGSARIDGGDHGGVVGYDQFPFRRPGVGRLRGAGPFAGGPAGFSAWGIRDGQYARRIRGFGAD